MVDELVETKEAASREFSLPSSNDEESTLIFSLHARMKVSFRLEKKKNCPYFLIFL